MQIKFHAVRLKIAFFFLLNLQDKLFFQGTKAVQSSGVYLGAVCFLGLGSLDLVTSSTGLFCD